MVYHRLSLLVSTYEVGSNPVVPTNPPFIISDRGSPLDTLKHVVEVETFEI